ncbi:MAG: biotin-dependent carboxyltransferase family protein [Verrucomicrobia bacterium]|nr:biotin-dependent carboxyltransferase family protein [Verrucomicrobiota bacterium]
MKLQIVELHDCGLGVSIQDTGRHGWRKFGVPVSGSMDDHAADWANRLLGNGPEAPVLELLLQGAKLEMLEDAWIAVTGADANCNVATWRAVRATKGDVIQFSRSVSGVWTYIAVEGGFECARFLGSASMFARGKLGFPCATGSILERTHGERFKLQSGVAGRFTPMNERRNYDSPLTLKMWRGPQWDLFTENDRGAFFSQQWTVSPDSDRVGYRLSGTPLTADSTQIISEPVRVGSVQIPEGGSPIVIMRDGPPVGGYPKLGIIDPTDISWLAQCRPGRTLKFQPAE